MCEKLAHVLKNTVPLPEKVLRMDRSSSPDLPNYDSDDDIQILEEKIQSVPAHGQAGENIKASEEGREEENPTQNSQCFPVERSLEGDKVSVLFLVTSKFLLQDFILFHFLSLLRTLHTAKIKSL